jgi:cytochrome P450
MKRALAMTDAVGARGEVLDIAGLPSLQSLGYDGGRDALRRFCAQAFAPGAPRFVQHDRGVLVVFRQADLRALAAAPEVATLAPNQLFPGVLADSVADVKPVGHALADLIKNQLFTSNPPLNPALRRVLLNQIGPKQTATHASMARELAAHILAGLPDNRPVDLVQDIAEPLTGRYWGRLAGLTDEEALEAAAEARNMTPMLFLRPSAKSIEEADRAAQAYRAAVEGPVMRSLAGGACPFVEGIAKDLAAVEIADDLDYGGYVPKSAGAFLAGNLFDGFHTAALAATNTLYALASRPAVWERLRAAPDLVAAAVSEALRLEPPVIHLTRRASTEVALDGVRIPGGTPILMMWGAANRDPAAFPDPEAFDLGRSQQGTTTFGGGAHICPGRFAASLLAKSLVEAFLEAGAEVQVADAHGSWIGNHAMCQLQRLEIVLKR